MNFYVSILQGIYPNFTRFFLKYLEKLKSVATGNLSRDYIYQILRKSEINTTLSSRSSLPEMFLVKGVLKICSKGEQPCRSVISIKLQSNFIEITLRYGCSPVNLLHIFRTAFSKKISGWLLLIILNVPL